MINNKNSCPELKKILDETISKGNSGKLDDLTELFEILNKTEVKNILKYWKDIEKICYLKKYNLRSQIMFYLYKIYIQKDYDLMIQEKIEKLKHKNLNNKMKNLEKKLQNQTNQTNKTNQINQKKKLKKK